MIRLLSLLIILGLVGCQTECCHYSDVSVLLDLRKDSIKIGDTLKVGVRLDCKNGNKIALLKNPISSLKILVLADNIIASSGAIRNKGEYSIIESPINLELVAIVGKNKKGPCLAFNTGDELSIQSGKNTLRVGYRPPITSLKFGDSDEDHPFSNVDFTFSD